MYHNAPRVPTKEKTDESYYTMSKFKYTCTTLYVQFLIVCYLGYNRAHCLSEQNKVSLTFIVITFVKQSVAMKFLVCLRERKEWLCGQGRVSFCDFDKILIIEKEKGGGGGGLEG